MARSRKQITVVRDDLIIHMEDVDGERKARKIPNLRELIPEAIDVIHWYGEPADGGPPVGEIQFDKTVLDRPNLMFDRLSFLPTLGVDIEAVKQAWRDNAPPPPPPEEDDDDPLDAAEVVVKRSMLKWFIKQADGKPWAAGELQDAIDLLKEANNA